MNNSATTRRISKIAVEYNGNDKGTAKCTATNLLLGNTTEQHFEEMNAIAQLNSKVQKWALTGYISPIKETGEKLSDEELTNIALEAMAEVGVTNDNQFRLDIHNSTRQKHIHFVANRINIDGKCTVKAHNIGNRFGEAVRRAAKRRGIKTDIEIGIEKRKDMLENLKACLTISKNFESLVEEMEKRDFLVTLSENEKGGISGMRITLIKDINHQTQRKYLSGYKLSEITRKLKIKEIKDIFALKALIDSYLSTVQNLWQLRAELRKEGFQMRIEYQDKANPKAGIKDIFIKPLTNLADRSAGLSKPKDGLFFDKYSGFPLFEIYPELKEQQRFQTILNAPWVGNTNNIGTTTKLNTAQPQSSIKPNLLSAAVEIIEELTKPTYTPKEDLDPYGLKRKKKGRKHR